MLTQLAEDRIHTIDTTPALARRLMMGDQAASNAYNTMAHASGDARKDQYAHTPRGQGDALIVLGFLFTRSSTT